MNEIGYDLAAEEEEAPEPWEDGYDETRAVEAPELAPTPSAEPVVPKGGKGTKSGKEQKGVGKSGTSQTAVAGKGKQHQQGKGQGFRSPAQRSSQRTRAAPYS